MQITGDDIGPILSRATPAVRRRDAETLVALMQEITGREGRAWGSIIGFGACHYRYPTGNEGDMPILAFAPRKAASVIYLDGMEAHAHDLAVLGPHTSSVGCLYVKDLELIDLTVLERILRRCMAWTEAGGSEQMRITITA
ncbi:hypothetical protein GCM10025768_04880 [Microbacterium pseudoresistens]|uniref:YdhG-like domain-containing protein n=1 Tax=Microbacterium pseudoresistens TaxID=640634 RepID=A0A7Y9JP47_9MICO|nr:DUF1801 domain-containing protein [Microbacterium pseudoresistens]NYD54324.1 hypothetical protein [Microbacterium pseudoresistens]